MLYINVIYIYVFGIIVRKSAIANVGNSYIIIDLTTRN